ncbi:MAG TPA: hypothetical protein VF796_24820, partial [Humisphaera sp.]
MTRVTNARRATARTGLVAFAAAVLGLVVYPLSAAAPAPPASNPASRAASRPAADDADFVLRAYEVGDLLRPPHVLTPDAVTPLTGVSTRNGGGGGGGLFGAGTAPPTPEMTLATLVRELAAPGTWTEVGGRGAVSFAGTRMLVRQRPDAQREVEAVLAALRDPKASPAALAVDGWWVSLSPADAAALAGPADAPRREVDPAALAKLPPAAVVAT